MKYKLKALQRTCEAFPAQWEGVTYCGKHVYIRYRWGSLRLSVADTEESAVRGGSAIADSKCIEHGHEYQGELSFIELMKLSEDFFDFNGCHMLEDDVNFYLYTVPAENLASAEYSPSFELKSMSPLLLGDAVAPEPGSQEITADKHKAFVDPERRLFKMVEEGVNENN